MCFIFNYSSTVTSFITYFSCCVTFMDAPPPPSHPLSIRAFEVDPYVGNAQVVKIQNCMLTLVYKITKERRVMTLITFFFSQKKKRFQNSKLPPDALQRKFTQSILTVRPSFIDICHSVMTRGRGMPAAVEATRGRCESECHWPTTATQKGGCVCCR